MPCPDTIIRIALARAAEYAHRPFIQSWFDASGRKTTDVHSITWGEAGELIRTVGKGLVELGVEAKDRVAVFSPNTPRWIGAAFGTLGVRGTIVPIYPTSSADDLWWCLHDSGSKVVLCHDAGHLARVLSVADRLEGLERIVVMDPDVQPAGEGVIGFDELLALGTQSTITDARCQERIEEGEPDDLAAIIYTSGTTGRPKGVMLTNANFVSQRAVAHAFDLGHEDVWLAHLPLCHSLGFSCDLLNAGFHGGTLFVADSVAPEQMRRNLATCRPTVMTSVPRLWEKLYLNIRQMVSQRPGAVQRIFEWSLGVGTERFLHDNEGRPLPAGLRFKARWADRVFGKVRARAGLDRLRVCFTGGGPISPDLLMFFGALGVNIYQGFGLTETSPVTHACVPGANRIGWVGRPIEGTECALAPDGELLIRGPQVMKGYLNRPEATDDAFTPDGFFRTGDIAEIQDGFVRIVDRKKEILITSGGKNIAPQKIQNAFNTDPWVEQAYAVGDGHKYVAALLVPCFEALQPWAAAQGIEWSDREQLVGHPRVVELYQQRVDRMNATLSGWETIKRFALLPHELSEAGGELTPTQKLRRRVVDEKYADVIASLYPDDPT